MLLALLVTIAGAAPLCAAVPGAAPSTACASALLRELGWQLQTGDGDRLVVHAGRPCDRADLHEARRAGDLRAVLPSTAAENASPGRIDAAIATLLADPATLCAYKYRLGAATRMAADRLAANRGYRFSSLQAGWIAFGGGARAQGWTPIFGFARGLQPRQSPALALDAFYRGRVRSECGVGRQVAQYAAQRELYGAQDFDRAFEPAEIVIGTFNKLHRTRSVLLGSGAGEFTADGAARATAALGRQGLVGLPGFIVHVFGADTLDDSANQAENFVIYDVDSAAAAALRAHAGFAHYNVLNRRIWELARPLQRRDLDRRWFERVLHQRDPRLRATLSDVQRARVAAIDALLDDPFYRGFRIYVHPLGVRPVGYHVVRLLDRNSRTPYRIELTLHNLHTTLYRRWIAYQLQRCADAADAVGDSPGRDRIDVAAVSSRPARSGPTDGE